MRDRVRRATAVVAMTAAIIVVVACTDNSLSSKDQPAPIAWTKVELPAGDEPVVLAGQRTELLIGLRHRGAKVVPRLLIQTADGRQSTVKIEPKSPYAFEAVWQSVATDGTRILAIGGAAGGAHSNTRWTVWSGTSAGVTEHPQEFNTFGGQAAGALYSAAVTPAGGALLGSWASPTSGLDAAVWLPKGDTWNRQNSARTALQSTPSLLVGPSFGTVQGAGIVLVGSQVRIAPNVVQQEAAVWRSRTLNQGWSRVALPEPGNRSQGVTASCTPANCVVSGSADGKLAMWQLDGSKATRLQGIPSVPLGDKDRLPPPIDNNGHLIQVVADSGKVKVISGRGNDWISHVATGATGTVTAAALVGDSLYLLAGPADGPATLWRTDVNAVR
jgi:hypothetical protein